jgi:hypothetical protein
VEVCFIEIIEKELLPIIINIGIQL